MRELEELNRVTKRIIGCGIEVHRQLGLGLLESIYEKALCHEFELNQLKYRNQVRVPIFYKGQELGEHRLDFLIEDDIIIELKAVDRMDPVFHAQLLSYLRLTNKRLGLLMNFNVPILRKGIKRIVL